MKKQRHDLFAAEHRSQKIAQFTKVLYALDRLVDWAALTKVVNKQTAQHEEINGFQTRLCST